MIYPQNFEQKIGFDSIRHLLKEKCLSTLGQDRVDEMNFSESFKDINEWLEQVMEFMRIIQEEDSFPDQYFFDVLIIPLRLPQWQIHGKPGCLH